LRVGGLYYERIVVIRAVSKTHRSPWQNNRSLYPLLSERKKIRAAASRMRCFFDASK
jgi:hypothetical protein